MGHCEPRLCILAFVLPYIISKAYAGLNAGKMVTKLRPSLSEETMDFMESKWQSEFNIL